MAAAADVRALEDACPWLRADFRADLARLADGAAEQSRRFAADARVLARLSAQVPRCALDETGATPWTSFRREVAVACKVSDRTAAADSRAAVRLVSVLPHTMDLLESGQLTVSRARAFITEVEVYDDELAGQLDADLADKAVLLPIARLVQQIRKAATALDPEAAALRTASKNAGCGVLFSPAPDDQASVVLFGPAVPLTRWYGTLDQRARVLKQAGDNRPLDALRFDLATSTYPCAAHAPADPTAPVEEPSAGAPATTTAEAAEPAATTETTEFAADAPIAASGLRPGFVEPASSDCRLSRPVQAMMTVPVETSLGLSNEPGWLDGYGWISAPTCRTLLVDAELRRVCVDSSTGVLLDLADRDERPPPGPDGLRQALLQMVLAPIELSDVGWRTEPQHDPSPRLRQLVELRDRTCDGPTGTPTAAGKADLDHGEPYPHGPTAAWNLVARARRTHQLKHYGWTALRTPTATFWTSPAGQIVEVPHHTSATPGMDAGAAALPDPHQLAAVDHTQLTAPGDDDLPPWLPSTERDRTEWTWLVDDSDPAEPAPF